MSGNQAKIGSALTAMFNLLLLGLIQNNLAVSVLVREIWSGKISNT